MSEIHKEEFEQKEGIIGREEPSKLAIDGVLFDPFQINSFAKLVNALRFKVVSQLREKAFKNMLENEEYVQDGNVYYMKGSVHSAQEEQTAIKLWKADYYVVFPGKGHIKEIKMLENDKTLYENDVYLYDRKTFYQQKADLKSVNGGSLDAIKNHIIDGSEQANVIVMDIPAKTSNLNVIKGIRLGWAKNTKTVLLNWKGQWYEIEKDNAYKKGWLENYIK
jgi:hypothetical protein